jgi:hypothetical protein
MYPRVTFPIQREILRTTRRRRSPLGPLFANAFMGDFERNHMSRLRELEVKQWCRYVDDIFACVGSSEEADKSSSTSRQIQAIESISRTSRYLIQQITTSSCEVNIYECWMIKRFIFVFNFFLFSFYSNN